MVVFIGVGITENDLFAKLVDSGARIESVKPTLQLLAEYIMQLQHFTIGNVVRMRAAATPTESLSLELVSKDPRGNA
jgi:hypothetical protein